MYAPKSQLYAATILATQIQYTSTPVGTSFANITNEIRVADTTGTKCAARSPSDFQYHGRWDLGLLGLLVLTILVLMCLEQYFLTPVEPKRLDPVIGSGDPEAECEEAQGNGVRVEEPVGTEPMFARSMLLHGALFIAWFGFPNDAMGFRYDGLDGGWLKSSLAYPAVLMAVQSTNTLVGKNLPARLGERIGFPREQSESKAYAESDYQRSMVFPADCTRDEKVLLYLVEICADKLQMVLTEVSLSLEQDWVDFTMALFIVCRLGSVMDWADTAV
ncbi:uncharacterized protein L3040_009408 [Drepanopeziza brunnea f. sp. 'multigermtubi']|uniref:Uncharacterized protein n=1 Tax=Marssonina brunnea f. sp. multigermtubi (strain MB_m1) TaxID=1072389 RepID=K1WGD8_MARBU|nr:uncharacterized protein MBM_09901 [Drepanopeziza brunnea f. sp. 'multigermtubi' MB_m1]EKD11931.1 hypothetical protein MBM_09901 [Drepanopeziza brunnea f. sp. 'multigermtubi' MB_m1]KAJ5032816.1 hypothetical protein L3040_009408 [Drepanopeziza brunnea f. sp. 'multigermtubi']